MSLVCKNNQLCNTRDGKKKKTEKHFVEPATHSKPSQKGRICSIEDHLLLDHTDISGRNRCLAIRPLGLKQQLEPLEKNTS